MSAPAFQQAQAPWVAKAEAKLKEAPGSPTPEQTRFIATQIIYSRLPDESLLWPVVEVAHTIVLRGGGESTSWHPHATIRVNGKQILREAKGYSDSPLPALFGNRLISVGRKGNADVYVLRPAA